MSISAAEFEALQLQLIELKTAKYESQDREKKLQNEIKTLKEHSTTLENDLKKAQGDPSSKFSLSGVMSNVGRKDKKEMAMLASENEALTRNLELATQEHKEQQEATMQNMKNLYAANKALEDEIEGYKKTITEKDRKIEAHEAQVRKLQIQLLQLESSANIQKVDHGDHGDQQQPGEAEGSAQPPKDQEGRENRESASEDLNRLRENVRMLSEQLRDLDEQHSKSEESYRSQVTLLEQQLSASREKVKQDEIATARMEARLEEELSKLLKDKEELITKLSNWEEQGQKDQQLTSQVAELKDQLADLTDKYSVIKTSRDEYMEEVKKVTQECESVSQAKVALETKLQESETEAELLRTIRDEHATVLGEQEATKNKIKDLQIALDRANAGCSELAEVTRDLEQVRKVLEDVKAHEATLQAELDTLKLEMDGLKLESAKVVPLEQEIDALKLAHLQATTESSSHKEQYESEHRRLIEAEASLQEANTKLAEATEKVTTLDELATKLKTEKDDLTTEHKIEERKNLRMIKELKSELQKERISLSRSVSMEQFPSVPPSPIPTATRDRHSPPMSPIPLTPPPHGTPRLNRKQAEAVNMLPLVSTNLANLDLSPSTMEEILRRDLDTSLTMVGKLGEDKWKLEEKARFLEENLALVNEDLVRKTKVIQHYVAKTKLVVTPEQLDKEKTNKKQGGVRGTLLRAGNDQGLSAELLAKMEAVLEETVLRNVQLQNDMVTLGDATGQLQKEIHQIKEQNKQLATENSHYKEQLVRVMSSQTA